MTSTNTAAKDFAPLGGVEAIADLYDHFILDIFGVIHDGIDLFPGTIDVLTRLKAMGKQTCLLSNSPRRAAGAAQQMDYMGLSRDLYDHVITSGEATYQALQSDYNSPEQRCWFIGPAVFHEVLEGFAGEIVQRPEDATFILNSIPGTEPSAVAKLKEQLVLSQRLGLPMICANPDLVVNIGDEQHECAGTFAAIYADMGGEVIYHGKPHQPVYEMAHQKLGAPKKSRVLAIGDSLHTDIAGANGFSIDSIFNLIGIHWEEVQMEHAPHLADIPKIQSIIAQQPHKPTYTLAGFDW